jgi:hypothetical protein
MCTMGARDCQMGARAGWLANENLSGSRGRARERIRLRGAPAPSGRDYQRNYKGQQQQQQQHGHVSMTAERPSQVTPVLII